MIVFLLAASAFAGWIDAVIGGGGLVLIPVLMSATAMPAASVLATNKVAAISGTASAAATLVRRVGVPRITWVYAFIAGVTAALGARAVSLIDATAPGVLGGNPRLSLSMEPKRIPPSPVVTLPS